MEIVEKNEKGPGAVWGLSWSQWLSKLIQGVYFQSFYQALKRKCSVRVRSGLI